MLLKTLAKVGFAMANRKILLGVLAIGAVGAFTLVKSLRRNAKHEAGDALKAVDHHPPPRRDKREMYHAPLVAAENRIRH